jgi:hypothetical protein
VKVCFKVRLPLQTVPQMASQGRRDSARRHLASISGEAEATGKGPVTSVPGGMANQVKVVDQDSGSSQ